MHIRQVNAASLRTQPGRSGLALSPWRTFSNIFAPVLSSMPHTMCDGIWPSSSGSPSCVCTGLLPLQMKSVHSATCQQHHNRTPLLRRMLLRLEPLSSLQAVRVLRAKCCPASRPASSLSATPQLVLAIHSTMGRARNKNRSPYDLDSRKKRVVLQWHVDITTHFPCDFGLLCFLEQAICSEEQVI